MLNSVGKENSSRENSGRNTNRRDFLKSAASGAAVLALSPSLATKSFASTSKSNGSIPTGYAYNPNFALFGYNGGDVPERVKWIDYKINQSGLAEQLEKVTPLSDPLQYIKKLHTAGHVSGIQSSVKQEDFLYSQGEIAEIAVSHVLGAVKDVCDGKLKNAFCNIRPPGHHAVNTVYTQGYCDYGNVVLAAEYALTQEKINKVLIIDWDYHQGNGTHSLICGNKNILFFETFSPYMYTTACDDLHAISPDDDVTEGSDRINVLMPRGSNNDLFIRVFEEKLVAAAEQFKPDMILISSGFDLKGFDSHGSHSVTSRGISQLTRIVMDIADSYSEGRIVSMLEGGYADSFSSESCLSTGDYTFYGLSECAQAHIATLSTGDVQAESDFYRRVDKYLCSPVGIYSQIFNKGSEQLRILNDRLYWDRGERQVISVNVYNLQGEVTGRLKTNGDFAQGLELRGLTGSQGASGRIRGPYIIKALFADGEMGTIAWRP